MGSKGYYVDGTLKRSIDQYNLDCMDHYGQVVLSLFNPSASILKVAFFLPLLSSVIVIT